MPMYIFYRLVLYYSTCNLLCSLIRNFILCANIVSVAGHSSSFASFARVDEILCY